MIQIPPPMNALPVLFAVIPASRVHPPAIIFYRPVLFAVYGEV